MLSIKINSFVEISIENGDKIVGYYQGINHNGVLLKNAKVYSEKCYKLEKAHVTFCKILDINTIFNA